MRKTNKSQLSLPLLRFKGFEGEWDQIFLDESIDINTGKKDLKDKNDNGIYPFYVRSENIEKINTYSFNGEAILIPGDGKIGDIFHYINGKFDYHQRVYKLSNKINSKINLKYLYYEFQKNIKKYLLSFSAKATVDSIRLPMLQKYKIFIPEFFEQQKIARFFSLLDKQISLWERKLELYELFYKYYLNKLLFNHDNNKFPLLRFKGFEKNEIIFDRLINWSNIFGAGIDKVFNDNENEGKMVNFTDVFHNVKLDEDYIFKSCTFTQEEYKKYKVEKGDILLTPSSEDKINIGLSSLININDTQYLLYSYHLNLLRVNDRLHPLYISYQLRTERVKKYFYNVSQGVSRYTLSKSDFENLYIFIPSLPEQQKIAFFLSLIDKLINYFSENILLTKELKKTYLNKLFI
ncbi:restriction endonuclease subunit S [Malacoplasma muris]|uniref:restriction endonuclease subunit S n=1 Tax=Malacoplasma muris TaxID=2119 RepID=UPI00398EB05A